MPTYFSTFCRKIQAICVFLDRVGKCSYNKIQIKVEKTVLFMRKFGLTNNQLKIIAMLTMTIDHIGVLLFPGVDLLRYIGRLAFPIYAFMIAEGCLHTRSMPRYLGSMAVLAALCQLVGYVAQQTLVQSVLVSFSFSISLIILLRQAQQKNTVGAWWPFALAAAAVLLITEALPEFLPGFSVDYGFIGAMLPVCIYAAKGKIPKLAVSAVLLSLLAWNGWAGQWYGLLALPLLALYNGSRGRWRLKWVFYLYYPIHLAVLWLIAAIF